MGDYTYLPRAASPTVVLPGGGVTPRAETRGGAVVLWQRGRRKVRYPTQNPRANRSTVERTKGHRCPHRRKSGPPPADRCFCERRLKSAAPGALPAVG